MKKNLFVALILCAVMTMPLAACGSTAPTKQEDNQTSEASSTTPSDTLAESTKETKGNNVEIPNPFEDCATLEDAAALAGFSLTAPEKIEGYGERTIMAMKDEMIQIVYCNADEQNSPSDEDLDTVDWEKIDFSSNEVTIRKAAGNEDISGDYTEYSSINTVMVDEMQVTMRGNDELVYTATWSNGGYTFAVSAGNGMSSESMIELVSAVK